MLEMKDAFHSGFVVQDIDAAIAEFHRHVRTCFTPVRRQAFRLRGPSGPFEVEMTLAFTVDGPFRLELIEPIPGTIWQMPHNPVLGPSPAHHLAFWCEDLATASARLLDSGAPRLATLDDASHEVSGFVYHRLPDGTVLELVDVRSRPAFEAWFAGGPFPGSNR